MYKIEIIKVEDATVTGLEFQKIADSGNKDDGGAIYGYVEFQTTKKVETTVLQQAVEEIDLPTVIKAVNGIK